MDPKILAAMWQIGVVRSDQLPDLAQECLLGGYDSPSLRMLAGDSDPLALDTVRLLKSSIEELGIGSLTADEAAMEVAVSVAGRVSRGELSPVEGAKLIDGVYDITGSKALYGVISLLSLHGVSEVSGVNGSFEDQLRKEILELLEKGIKK